MGLYNEGLDLSGKFSFIGKIKWVILAVIIVAILAAAAFTIPSMIPKQKILSLSFVKSPIKAGESTLLRVTLTNSYETDIGPIIVQARPVDEASLSVFPSDLNVLLLGKGERKNLEFSVLPKKEIFKGDYSIEVKAIFDGNVETIRGIIKVE